MSEVILTKLTPPAFNSTQLIARPRLLELLTQQEERKLILVIAPAGYGKTVFMQQLANMLNKPLVWCQLDNYDNDLAVVIKYILAGILQSLSKTDSKIEQLLTKPDAAHNPRLVIMTLVNGLLRLAPDGMVLVFDDYHFITESPVHDFFQELLQYLPTGIEIMISSRHPIPLALARFDLAGKVFSIEAEDLRFTRQEMEDFLTQRKIKTSGEILDALEQKTAGWPMALHFFQGCLSQETQRLHELEMKGIFNYLVSEVLNAQPGHIQRFLLATSVLNLLSPETCDMLLERNDSAAILDYLEKEQIFLNPLEGKDKTYRYHQLFQELLFDRLGAERKVLSRRAGDLARQLGEIMSAVKYYQAAGSRADVIDLIKEAGLQVIRNGQWQTVAHWLELLTQEDLQQNPWLSFFRATVEVYRGRNEEAERFLRQSKAGFNVERDQLGLIESSILRARIMSAHGNYQASLDQLEQVYSKLSPAEISKRFYLPLEKTYCLAKLGRLHEAESILTRALEAAKTENNGYIMTYLMEGLASIYYLQGEYPKSLQTYRLALQTSPEKNLPGYYIQDSIVGIYGDWGETDQAFEIAKRNVASKEKLGMFETLPSAYMFLGAVHLLRGEYQPAESSCRRGISMVEENMGDRYMNILLKNFLAWSVYAQGRWVEARALMEKNLGLAREMGGLIFPCSLMMSGTVWALLGETGTAIRELSEAANSLEEIGCRVPLCCTYKALAWSLYNKGVIEKANHYARRYLELGAKINLLDGYLIMTYDFLEPILRYGLENNIEVNYIQLIMVQAGIRSLKLLRELVAHHDPEVRQKVIIPLMEIGSDEAESLIRLLLNDKNTVVRKYALTTARKLEFLKDGNTYRPKNTVLLEIKTLGPLRVFWGEKEITAKNWPTVKTRELLAYFAHHQDPVTTERILEDLWPEVEREKGLSNFHITLHRLRQTLLQVSSKNLVLYGTKQYQLLPGEFITDHLRFEELVKSGLTGLNRTSEGDASGSVAELEEAVAIYRGDYLSELDYTWLVSYQEHLKQLHFEAKSQLARYYLHIKEFNQVIIHLQALVKTNPLMEEIHCLLMTAYYRLGDRLAVRNQYQTLMAALDEELCLTPSPDTTELYYKLGGLVNC
jgi:LuxR family transcriptional regulator, maltose regulon positive regulatory protein